MTESNVASTNWTVLPFFLFTKRCAIQSRMITVAESSSFFRTSTVEPGGILSAGPKTNHRSRGGKARNSDTVASQCVTNLRYSWY